MSDFLRETSSLFENVRLANVSTMLDVLTSSNRRDKDFLRRRYLERATHFETTLAFVKENGFVDERENVLCPKDNGVSSNEREIPLVVLPRLLDVRSRFRNEVLQYLRHFQIVECRPIHRPTSEQRSVESEIRNFFMELGIIAYDTKTACYVLGQEYYSLMLLAHRSVSPIAPSKLRENRKNKEDFGFSAELEIVSFERGRVGEQFANHVKHIAAVDTSAGYDIESVTVGVQSEVSPRCIEVKAVSADDYRFYWTSKELAVAQTMRSWYYLYLLPTNGRGAFLPERLRMISDPATNVLERLDQWNVELNVLECRLKAN